jgi:hypothetical protein
MNAGEGLKRIATVTRWAGYIFGGFFLVVAIVGSGAESWVFLIPAALFATGGWVAAWIIEGFAKPKA